MAEFSYNPVQLVEPNQNVILNTVIPCNKGYIYHRNESGLVILRGVVNCPTACSAKYLVEFSGNIAIPDGATAPAEIAVAFAVDGEVIQNTTAAVTPTATDAYFNVSTQRTIEVPRGCCFGLSVENATVGATAATAPIAINMRNANLTVSRVA